VARKLLILWLFGWALFGFPWTTFSATPRFGDLNLVPFRWGRRRDQLLNFAYYVPFGIIGGLLGWPAALVTIAAIGLSSLTEAVQIFSVDRVPSVTDLLLNTAGAVVGIAIITFLRARRRA
jgi:glycopeptide antibiotics resistance protein